MLADDPHEVVGSLVEVAARGASAEQLARAVALAAALRLVRFHTQNDVGDWDAVHHSFTTANAVHQAVVRQPTLELVRVVVLGAVRVCLDRFLNVPAARLPDQDPRSLDELEACSDGRGGVDDAGRIVVGHLASGGPATRCSPSCAGLSTARTPASTGSSRSTPPLATVTDPAHLALLQRTLDRTLAPVLPVEVAAAQFGLALGSGVGTGQPNAAADVLKVQDLLHSRWHLGDDAYGRERTAASSGGPIPETIAGITRLKAAALAGTQPRREVRNHGQTLGATLGATARNDTEPSRTHATESPARSY